MEARWKSPLQQRQRERDALLCRIEAALRADERVVAAWLAGSLGRGDADALSDIDLWIVADDAMSAIGAGPRRFVSDIVAPCLVIDVPRNAPPNGAYLFTHIPGDTGAHQVDWYWQTASNAARSATTKLLFERWPIPLEAAPAPLDHDALVAQLS
ncbi:MAG: nucleotidyltransferase domain-containing protein, partial [Chloroflexota bacterium]|nr:nucleotidyltransferase domain-containing protein [Chloroflexota bacterium]